MVREFYAGMLGPWSESPPNHVIHNLKAASAIHHGSNFTVVRDVTSLDPNSYFRNCGYPDGCPTNIRFITTYDLFIERIAACEERLEAMESAASDQEGIVYLNALIRLTEEKNRNLYEKDYPACKEQYSAAGYNAIHQSCKDMLTVITMITYLADGLEREIIWFDLDQVPILSEGSIPANSTFAMPYRASFTDKWVVSRERILSHDSLSQERTIEMTDTEVRDISLEPREHIIWWKTGGMYHKIHTEEQHEIFSAVFYFAYNLPLAYVLAGGIPFINLIKPCIAYLCTLSRPIFYLNLVGRVLPTNRMMSIDKKDLVVLSIPLLPSLIGPLENARGDIKSIKSALMSSSVQYGAELDKFIMRSLPYCSTIGSANIFSARRAATEVFKFDNTGHDALLSMYSAFLTDDRMITAKSLQIINGQATPLSILFDAHYESFSIFQNFYSRLDRVVPLNHKGVYGNYNSPPVDISEGCKARIMQAIGAIKSVLIEASLESAEPSCVISSAVSEEFLISDLSVY